MEGDCVEIYLTTCEQNKIAPQLAVVRGLKEQEVNVRHRCLGDQDAHALSAALCVRRRLHTLIELLFVCISFVLLFCTHASVSAE